MLIMEWQARAVGTTIEQVTAMQHRSRDGTHTGYIRISLKCSGIPALALALGGDGESVVVDDEDFFAVDLEEFGQLEIANLNDHPLFVKVVGRIINEIELMKYGEVVSGIVIHSSSGNKLQIENCGDEFCINN